MPMAANGLAKLGEELGELMQVVGKKLAYYDTDVHPDGGPALSARLEEEMADVVAAIFLVKENLNLDDCRINERIEKKLALFRKWHIDSSSNLHGIDAAVKSMET